MFSLNIYAAVQQTARLHTVSAAIYMMRSRFIYLTVHFKIIYCQSLNLVMSEIRQ